jgi:hypothetical protein
MLANNAIHSLSQNDSYCKDEHFVARYYRVSLGTVRRWRYLGRGPRYRKIGNHLVRYCLSDLEDWLASRPNGGDVTTKGTNRE